MRFSVREQQTQWALGNTARKNGEPRIQPEHEYGWAWLQGWDDRDRYENEEREYPFHDDE